MTPISISPFAHLLNMSDDQLDQCIDAHGWQHPNFPNDNSNQVENMNALPWHEAKSLIRAYLISLAITEKLKVTAFASRYDAHYLSHECIMAAEGLFNNVFKMREDMRFRCGSYFPPATTSEATPSSPP